MSNLDIEPADVIKLLEQYLKENNLLKSLQTLQDETSVSLNTVDSIDSFVNDITAGRWDVVLRTVRLLKLPDDKLFDLYEQIVIELIELREIKAATWMTTKTDPLLKLKLNYPDRYLHLQNLSGRSFFDHNIAYRDGGTKERRRMAIANELKKEIRVVPPQRLLSLLGDAMKWQKHEGLLPSGSMIDIFSGKARMCPDEDEKPPVSLHKHCIKPIASIDGETDEDSPIFVCCAEFSPDGTYLVVGYSTGLIEVRNSTTGRLSKDLKYQAQQDFMMTPTKMAALCVCFNQDNNLLAVGDKPGDISVWLIETGQLVQHFHSAHIKSISCILFHKSGKEILSGSHDTTIKMHGMRSNRTIRDFRGHKSFVQAIAFSSDDNFVVSGSSDKTVKIWNCKTAQEVASYTSTARVHSVFLMPQFKSDIFLIGSRSTKVHMIDLTGKLRAKLTYIPGATGNNNNKNMQSSKQSDGVTDGDHVAPAGVTSSQVDKPSTSKSHDNLAVNLTECQFYSVCPSTKGNWIYTVDTRHIYCFNFSSKKVETILRVHDTKSGNDVIGVKHHPLLNLLATFDTQGNLKLWKS